MSDAIVNVISAVTTTFSRIVFVCKNSEFLNGFSFHKNLESLQLFVATNLMFYIATTIDMFADILTLLAKSIIAAFVDSMEIGLIFHINVKI